MDCTTFLPVRASAFYPRYQELAQLSCSCISSKLHVFLKSMQNIAKKYVSLYISSFSLDIKVLK